jgi:hypothetical protein
MEQFSKNLIKGKIAETIFELMFREADKYTIIPFGYEKNFPEFIQFKKRLSGAKKVIDNIKNAPDFAIISKDRDKIYLVEVKYRANYNAKEIIKIAKEQGKRWRPSCLFLASRDGFYYDLCSTISKKGGISKLRETMIPMNLQIKYLTLLKEFEQ